MGKSQSLAKSVPFYNVTSGMPKEKHSFEVGLKIV
jgi:hypothetical protein